ncbi:BRO family protein [Mesorhizobium australicum]|uniref:BRO-N domain-containing protein n=1 Tax=Mesorhizobium australicum TaxID=536018 RepID=UPI003337574D
MNALSTFNFNTSAIRVVTIDGNPWFVARDLAAPLAWTVANVRMQTGRNLGADERREQFVTTTGGPQQMVLVSESGFYKLILRAQRSNPRAKEFQDWVTKAVLPAIRKDGGYILGEEKVATGEMSEDELVFKAMDVMKRKIERLSSENAIMAKELNEVTVDEYRALRHAYWPHGFKVRMGQWASSLCRARGIEVARQTRTIVDAYGKVHVTSLKVYQRAILDEVYEELSYLLPVAA